MLMPNYSYTRYAVKTRIMFGLFASMMGETYFSELTLYDRRGHGTVTTEEFGQFIQTSAEKLHMLLDPER